MTRKLIWAIVAIIFFVALIIALILLLVPSVSDVIKVYQLDACTEACEEAYVVPSDEYIHCVTECVEKYKGIK